MSAADTVTRELKERDRKAEGKKEKGEESAESDFCSMVEYRLFSRRSNQRFRSKVSNVSTYFIHISLRRVEKKARNEEDRERKREKRRSLNPRYGSLNHAMLEDCLSPLNGSRHSITLPIRCDSNSNFPTVVKLFYAIATTCRLKHVICFQLDESKFAATNESKWGFD